MTNGSQYADPSSSSSSSSPSAAALAAPSISMTPPSTEPSAYIKPLTSAHSLSPPRPIMQPPPLVPLPVDPNNILPLSLPPSPLPSPPSSRMASPLPTPQPSSGDLQAEYNAQAGPSASPRTSISTSSSRPGWSGGRSDSRSSAEDDSSPTYSHVPHRAWWFRPTHGYSSSQDGPVSPKVLMGPPTSIPRRRITSTSRLLPTGTRSWGWLLELFTGTLYSDDGRSGRVRAGRRNRERDKLMAGSSRSKLSAAGPKWMGRLWYFVPTQPLTIIGFLMFAAFLIVTITLTIKHILNPDKEPLPWRQYCTSNYPTLYSLQDPSAPHQPWSHGTAGDMAFTDLPPSKQIPVNSFANSWSTVALAPLTADHPIWPYAPHDKAPFTAESHNLDEALAPVGVLIGVFTTDAGAERRHMIRQSYASHWRSRRDGTEGVRVRFVMARPRPKYAKAVQLEIEAFNDIILLDMPEKMNSGKTHAFFSWAAENATVPDWEYPTHPRSSSSESDFPLSYVSEDGSVRPSPIWRGERRPDYVVKADEDSFIMLGELERRLRIAPRSKAYWGYLVKNLFMAGECYGLSFDLVQYIAASPALRTLTHGKEDKLVAKWMKMHPEREEIVWVAEKCWIYDHPKAGTVYSHGFLYPSEVSAVRRDNVTGLSPTTLEIRGGEALKDTYSSVSKWGTTYRSPVPDLSTDEAIEALVEGSPLSQLRDHHLAHGNQQAYSKTLITRQKVREAYANRPTREERFLGDKDERGGTVVVHYIKKNDWFIETMVAMLGTADEQGVWHRGVGTGLGALERRKGRVAGGAGEEGRVKVGKDAGL